VLKFKYQIPVLKT